MSIDNPVKEPSRSVILAWQTVFFVCALIAVAAIVLIQPEINDFRDRTIGITVVKNINAYYRNYIYIFALIACVAFACGIFLRFPSSIKIRPLGAQDSLSWLLAVCSCLNLMAYFIVNSGGLFLRAGLFGFILLALWLMTQRLMKQQVKADQDEGSVVYFLCLCLSWQAASLFLLVLAPSLAPGFAEQLTLIFCMVWLAGFGVFLAFHKYVEKSPAQSDDVFLTSIAQAGQRWLLVSPLLFVVANELSYFLFQRNIQGLSPAGVFSLLSFLVLAVYVLQKKQHSPGVFKLALCVLVSNIVFIEYSAQIQYGYYDLFHFGERLLPLQQWDTYGLLPFVDYIPTHGLFDALPHLIYQQLGATSPFEALVWGNGYFIGWLTRVVAIAIVFSFLAKIINPFSAFFLLWLLPSFHLVDPYYSLLLLPAIHVLNIQRMQNKNSWWLIQWLLTMMLMLWRLDFGIVLLVGNFAVLFLHSWYYQRLSSGVKGLLVGVCVMGLCLGLFVLLSDGRDAFVTLAAIKAYVSSQIIATSYEAFYKEVNYLLLMQVVILPGSAALIAAYSLSQLIRRKTPDGKFPLDLLIVFLGVVTLILSLRSLHRHSVVEGGFKNYLFLLLMLLFLVRYWFQGKLSALAIFIMVSFLVVPKGEKPIWKNVFHLSPKWEYPFALQVKKIPGWETNPVRLEDNVTAYKDFIGFMNQTLEKDQSFYDFSNAPLLYVLADVELPVYVTEPLFQTSDTLQKQLVSDLQSWRAESRLPFVVFRQNNQWDYIDGVDNVLRSYRIAEFIYQAYIPCVKLGQFDLWIDRRMASSNECQNRLQDTYSIDPALREKMQPLNLAYLQQNVAFYHLPFLWAKLDKETENVARSETFQLKDSGRNQWTLINEEALGCMGAPCYLDLEVDSKNSQQIELSFFSATQLSFAVEPGRHRYRIRISSLWHWFRMDTIKALTLLGETRFELHGAELVILDQAMR